MFSCLRQMWQWMDITGMENKKCGFQSQNLNVTSNSINSNNDSSLKHTHQHNTPPQHRIIQYGIKIPSHQHAQVSQSPSFHTLNFPLYTHVHHPNNQLHFQPAHRHLQAPSQYKNINIHQNFSLPLPQKYIHPHQKQNNQQNQSMYQTTQVSHSNQNQISQNSPQAWVPYQPPPIHYHPKPAGGNDETQKSTQMTPAPQQKSKEVTDKKKSSSTTTQIRFPIAKRPPEAPVTMQGWLHKQGSEGLMLWKKRWFVLSEYCLFYYKGIEEDKLLGSILLPSYKVSICKPEEKLSKKFCFKCEHVNMRTYILAAETHELMMQWVRVLSLASLMQTLSDNSQSSRSLESSRMNQNLSINSSESPGIHYVNKQNNYKPPSTSIHTQSASNCTMEADVEASSNQSQQEQSSCNQPLYANAPPKPRRLNDGYSSPSPDFLDKYNKGGYSDPVYDVRSTAKSPSIYGQNQAHRGMPPDFYQHYSHYTNEYGECMVTPTRELHVLHSTERRTPDTYGRSKLQSVEFQRPADYEDIYDEQSMYKRPLSPAAYSHVIRRNNNPPTVTPVYRAYTPVEMIGPVEHSHYVISQTRKMPVSSIVRPHSADFLEYEMNRHPNSLAKNQQPRPKSSLDINRNVSDNDNYFYSEEQYANKMRKSIQYLQKVPHTPIPQETDKNFPLLRSSTQPIHFNPFLVSDGPSDCQPTRSRSVLSEGSLSKEIDIELDSSHLDRGNTNEYVMRDRCRSANRNVKHRDHDPFIRSASARLTQNSPQPMHQTPMDENQLTREGERKREESMRRLLEWKQRMLQSPLNRKSQQGNKPIHKYSDSYQDNNCSLQDQNHLRHSFQNHQPNERRPSNVAPYTSYSSDDEASGSVSINTRDMSRINVRDTFPKAISSKGVWASHMDSRPVTHSYRSVAKDQHGIPKSQCPYINSTPIHSEIDPDSSKDNWPLNDKMNVSAGELLGRTHEELVLLLIQLRRRNAQTLQAIESCYKDIDTTQANLRTIMDQSRRLENLQKLDQIKKHLLELEKQYEKGKPLVNLVDNMVKLGSLYRAPTDRSGQIDNIREKLQFNQQIQERRLLFEEKRDWDRIHTDHLHFQEKVQQLYQLDRLIQEESGILQNLQQDKEDIEQALGGLKRRLSKGLNDPAEIEHARQQQILLENELSRVHLMLAQNSKKLEETVAGNARLEQELLVLKQKLQNSKQQRSSQQYSNAGDSLTCAITLESELQKIQKKVGDLQKQRQELSFQVKQLTDRSSSLTPQKSSAQNSQWNKKKIPSLWRETDLDTMSIVDHGESAETSRSLSCSTSPLYINTESKQMGETEYYNNRNLRSSDSTSDSTSINSNLQHEKQEIKTVRIIKRESERRHRDREKISTGRSEILLEEDDSSQCSSVLFRPTPVQKVQSATSLIPCPYDDNERSRILTGINSVSSPNLPQCFEGEVTSSEDISTDKSPQLSPMFKSEAARQIITEISEHDPPKQFNRRTIPKEKRRHYTAPHNHLLIKSLNQLPLGHNAFDQAVFNTRRARDDMDMERALRQRIDAPDIVRSTLSNKELKYNENTIDNILGTPNKINIPERYIPEQLPQLSVEEQEYRLKKVESIKKMLSDTTIISSSSSNLNIEDKERDNSSPSSIMNKATSKMMEEKKQREHLLQLNQILAKQVMEMSKIVAVKALAKLPLKVHQPSTEEDDSSPLTPLPIYQQRDNFYS